MLNKVLPDFLLENVEMNAIAQTQAGEVQLLESALADLALQLSPFTATWAMYLYEQQYGIPVDELKPVEDRRSLVVAKIRGTGATTIQLVKNTALAFTNGQIEVIEDPANSKVTIKFVSSIGIPPNADDFQATMAGVVPAHLEIVYEYTYNTYADLAAFTHTQLAAKTYSQLRETNL